MLDERVRRLWAAAEARSAGRGGIAAVVRATGISESTVLRGLADLDSGVVPLPGKVRRHPGRVPISEREPGLEEDLDRLVDPVTRGDPESPLRWTSKSGAKLAAALQELGHDVVERTVLRLLKAKGYSLQANRKTREGASHPGVCHRICVRRDRTGASCLQSKKRRRSCSSEIVSICMAPAASR